MTKRFLRRIALVYCLIQGVFVTHSAGIAQETISPNSSGDVDGFNEEISFSRMPGDQVRTELVHWLATTGAAPEKLHDLTTIWADDESLARLSGEELLDLLLEAFATVDTSTARMLDESYGSGPVDAPVFDGIREAAIYRNQVQQFRARWLVQHRFYDEALPLLKELVPDDVVDPAGLLFYRAVCEAELLKRTDALDSLSLLLNNTLDVPDRFQIVAELLKKDLEGRKDDGMDRVTQLMGDVERRLDLGRSGEKTQGQQDAIVAALDKLLEEMDKKNQQQNGGGGSGSQGNQSGQQGANQSQIKGASGEGTADRKNVHEKGKWGMLDQKTEASVRELIRDRFPPNFLDQIGRYTRKLAEQKK